MKSIQSVFCKRKYHEQRDPYDGVRFWSAATHGVGCILSVIGTVFLYRMVVPEGNAVKTASLLVYGCSMVALYLSSTLYHALRTSVKGRVFLRKLDHGAIYLLIAGCYTPVCMVAIPGTFGYGMLAFVWFCAVIGVVSTIFTVSLPRFLVSMIYLMMGWMAVLLIKPLMQVISGAGIALLLLCGGSYTIGGVLYALKKPLRDAPRFGCHEVFHLFILLGSVFFFFFVKQYVLCL